MFNIGSYDRPSLWSTTLSVSIAYGYYSTSWLSLSMSAILFLLYKSLPEVYDRWSSSYRSLGEFVELLSPILLGKYDTINICYSLLRRLTGSLLDWLSLKLAILVGRLER